MAIDLNAGALTSSAEGLFTETSALTIIFWFLLVFGLLLVFFFLTVGIWYMTYRIRVRYYQVVGTNLQGKEALRFIGTDKAKLIKDRGNIYRIRFFWKRKKIEPPPTEAYLPTKKGFEMHVKTDGMNFNPMVLNSNPGFAEVPMHKRLWLIQTQKQALDQYSKPSFWEKYGTLILTGTTVILCLGAMAFTIWYVAKLGGYAIQSYSSAIIEAGKSGVAKVAPGS